ncbi:MAG: PorT family protein [Bacteroidales bacterium]|nr:PorT family protein [Bacteroidales bacterium]
MKRLIPIFFLILSMGSEAQFTFGLRAGLNSNKYILENNTLSVENARFGFVGGMFFRIQSGFFSFQPEVLYSQKNGKYTYSTLESGLDTLFKNNFNFVDIPFIFNLHFGKAVRLNSGPVFNLLLKEDVRYIIENDANINSITDQVSNVINVAWQAGFGLEIKNICFDIRYEYSLNKVMQTFYIPGAGINLNPEARNSLWQFTLGIKFGNN